MRELKHIEKKLLKKQDFFDWKNVSSIKKQQVVQWYRLSSWHDYDSYNILVGFITKLIGYLEKLPQEDSFRVSIQWQLLNKLYDTGLINDKENLEQAKKVNVSCFLRRRFIV